MVDEEDEKQPQDAELDTDAIAEVFAADDTHHDDDDYLHTSSYDDGEDDEDDPYYLDTNDEIIDEDKRW